MPRVRSCLHSFPVDPTDPVPELGLRVLNHYPGITEAFWGRIAYNYIDASQNITWGVEYDDGDVEEYKDNLMRVMAI